MRAWSPLQVGSSSFPMYVAKRPGCDEFLRRAAESFELVVFTASVEAVSHSLSSIIPTQLPISHGVPAVLQRCDGAYRSTWLRRTCTGPEALHLLSGGNLREGSTAKHTRRRWLDRSGWQDLSRLGRVLKDCILLDNNADCYLFQPENAIPINSWYDDPEVSSCDTDVRVLTFLVLRTRTCWMCLASWMLSHNRKGVQSPSSAKSTKNLVGNAKVERAG